MCEMAYLDEVINLSCKINVISETQDNNCLQWLIRFVTDGLILRI